MTASRRSILAMFGAGSAAAAIGNSSDVMRANIPPMPPPDPFMSASQGMQAGYIGGSVDYEAAMEAEHGTAMTWLRANGLPQYVRDRIRRQADEQSRAAVIFPPEIEAYRSFAPHVKRRMYAEMIARRHEQGVFQEVETSVISRATRALVPGFLRRLSWF
jgi:hypothetical protein